MVKRCKYAGVAEGCTLENCPGTQKCPGYHKQAALAYARSDKGKVTKGAYLENHKGHKAAYDVEFRKVNPIRAAVACSLREHRALGYTTTVTLDEAEAIFRAATHCRYCGRELTCGTGKLQETSRSLDRTDNSMVISKDNTQAICHQCNTTKGARSHAEFIAYMKRALELNL